MGELSEIFQWKSDAVVQRNLPSFSDAERSHVEEEMSDVRRPALSLLLVPWHTLRLQEAFASGESYGSPACRCCCTSSGWRTCAASTWEEQRESLMQP